jgi:hypothetical protein
MSNMFDSILAKKTEYETAVKSFGKEALKDHFMEFFNSHPEVEAVRWTQYTPYFNDGDACTFQANEFTVRFAKGTTITVNKGGNAGADWYEEGDGFYASSYNSDNQVVKNVDKLSEIPSDVLLAVFGDHVKVTATRAGFEVDDYNHD